MKRHMAFWMSAKMLLSHSTLATENTLVEVRANSFASRYLLPKEVVNNIPVVRLSQWANPLLRASCKAIMGRSGECLFSFDQWQEH